jgi:hypothetical protein
MLSGRSLIWLYEEVGNHQEIEGYFLSMAA